VRFAKIPEVRVSLLRLLRELLERKEAHAALPSKWRYFFSDDDSNIRKVLIVAEARRGFPVSYSRLELFQQAARYLRAASEFAGPSDPFTSADASLEQLLDNMWGKLSWNSYVLDAGGTVEKIAGFEGWLSEGEAESIGDTIRAWDASEHTAFRDELLVASDHSIVALVGLLNRCHELLTRTEGFRNVVGARERLQKCFAEEREEEGLEVDPSRCDSVIDGNRVGRRTRIASPDAPKRRADTQGLGSALQDTPPSPHDDEAERKALINSPLAILTFEPRLRTLSVGEKSTYLSSLLPVLRKGEYVDHQTLHHLYRLFAVMDIETLARQTFIKGLISPEKIRSQMAELKHFEDELVRLSLLKDALALTRENTIDAEKIGYCFWLARELAIVSPESESFGSKLRGWFSGEYVREFGSTLEELGGALSGKWGVRFRTVGIAASGAHRVARTLPNKSAKSRSPEEFAALRNDLEALIIDSIESNLPSDDLASDAASARLHGFRERYEVALRGDAQYLSIGRLLEFPRTKKIRKQVSMEVEALLRRVSGGG
jgi:hypothetical protein